MEFGQRVFFSKLLLRYPSGMKLLYRERGRITMHQHYLDRTFLYDFVDYTTQSQPGTARSKPAWLKKVKGIIRRCLLYHVHPFLCQEYL
jgi:hypothetical protein